MEKPINRRIKWEDMESFINEPVFEHDDSYEGYRILVGYKRYKDAKFVMFSDGNAEIAFDKIRLYITRVK